jgi:hypothetical protein
VFKLRKLLSISLLVVVPTTSFFFATSCAETQPDGDYDSEYAEYINDRTFSIVTVVTGSDLEKYYSFGTA